MAARTVQKERTRQAIIEAARALVVENGAVTMPAVAAGARVSEATAYRYYPDLVSLLRDAVADVWPAPEDMVALDGIDDLAERVARVAEAFCARTLAHEISVRALVAASLTGSSAQRPVHRFEVIEHALAPVPPSPERTELVQRLAMVISAEALFTLLDLCGLGPAEATTSLARCAAAVVDSTEL